MALPEAKRIIKVRSGAQNVKHCDGDTTGRSVGKSQGTQNVVHATDLRLGGDRRGEAKNPMFREDGYQALSTSLKCISAAGGNTEDIHLQDKEEVHSLVAYARNDRTQKSARTIVRWAVSPVQTIVYPGQASRRARGHAQGEENFGCRRVARLVAQNQARRRKERRALLHQHKEEPRCIDSGLTQKSARTVARWEASPEQTSVCPGLTSHRARGRAQEKEP